MKTNLPEGATTQPTPAVICVDPNCATCAEGRRIDAEHEAHYGAKPQPIQNTPASDELRDSLSREFECGYAQLNPTQKVLVDRRVEQLSAPLPSAGSKPAPPDDTPSAQNRNGLCWFGDGSCNNPQTSRTFYCAEHEFKPVQEVKSRKTYSKNGYWICRCGVVAMPLTDDTSCDCGDIYEQEWNFVEISKPASQPVADGGGLPPTDAEFLSRAEKFMADAAKLDNAPIGYMVAAAFKNEDRAQRAERQLASSQEALRVAREENERLKAEVKAADDCTLTNYRLYVNSENAISPLNAELEALRERMQQAVEKLSTVGIKAGSLNRVHFNEALSLLSPEGSST